MEEKNKEMEEAIKEWADYKMNLKNKEKLDIIFAELGNNGKAKDLVSDLIVDIQESFFKLGKQVARMEME
ncbi:PRD domain protein [Leptotrichia trevisanii]|uniref:hypothetical protein n=1 Tax=Leptotrichia trevisanii TaxID=109328 RepID=UPI00118C904C|nr:hypothetical protein [Leptotrichia trevisanii]BBM56493.1 PRD domain protein [Leptotrichia trevisanii]